MFKISSTLHEQYSTLRRKRNLPRINFHLLRRLHEQVNNQAIVSDFAVSAQNCIASMFI